jgi:hypothetical protein
MYAKGSGCARVKPTVDQGRDHSHQRPMQKEMGFNSPTHPERSEKAHDEGPGGSSRVQEIVAETQAERNNRENESYFREQPAEQNSSPSGLWCYSFSYSRAAGGTIGYCRNQQ